MGCRRCVIGAELEGIGTAGGGGGGGVIKVLGAELEGIGTAVYAFVPLRELQARRGGVLEACLYTHTHTHTYIHTYVYTYTYMLTYIYMHT